ncbi:hypothetical protein ACFL5Q_03295 [Planctomycetota bacterium]
MGDNGIRFCFAQHPARRLVLVVVVLVAGAAFALAQERAPAPDAAAQARAQRLLRDVYGEEFDAAKTSAQKTELAKKLLDQAAKSKADPASHFVLLRVAKDVAVLAGDAETALEAARRIVDTFDVDPVKTKLGCLQAVTKAAKLSSQHGAIAQQAFLLVDVAMAEDDFESASKLSEIARESARRTRDYPLVKQIVARLAVVKQAAEEYAEYRKTLAALEDKPTDPQANLSAGRYLCLVKGDWDRGIPMLALGGDPALKALATKELEGAASSDEEAALGDGWWDLAQVEQGDARKSMMRRAGSWYRAAQAGVSSLVKMKIDGRLEEIGIRGPIELPSSVRQPVFKFDDEAFTAQYWLWNGEWTLAGDGGKAPTGVNLFLRTRYGYRGDLSIDMDFSFERSKYSNTGGCWITVWGQKLVISDTWRSLTARIHIHREGDEIVFVHNGEEKRIPVEPSVWSKPTVIEIHWHRRASHFRRIEIKAQTVVALN